MTELAELLGDATATEWMLALAYIDVLESQLEEIRAARDVLDDAPKDLAGNALATARFLARVNHALDAAGITL